MAALLLNPIYLVILCFIWITYTLLIFKFARKKENAAFLEKVVIIGFLLSITGVTVFPFPRLDPSALAGVDKTLGSAIVQLGIYASVVFVLSSRFRHFFQSTIYLFTNPFLGLLIILTVASALWSETPIVTLRYGVVSLVTSIFAAHLAIKYNWQEIFNLLRWSNTLVALASVLYFLVAPSSAIDLTDGTRWIGVLGHPITLGNLMALNIVLWYFQVTREPKHRLLAIGSTALSFAVMLFARSAGALFTFLVTIALLESLRSIKKLSFNRAFIAIIFFSILGVSLSILLVENLEGFLNVFGKESTLTGRTEFWPQLFEAIQRHPLLGHGYYGFWQSWRGNEDPASGIMTAGGFIPTHAHNGFLDLTLHLGFIGLLLFTLSLLQNLAQGIRYMSRCKLSEATLPIPILIFLVMKNVSQNGLWEIGLDLFLYIFVTVRLSIDSREKATSDRQSVGISASMSSSSN